MVCDNTIRDNSNLASTIGSLNDIPKMLIIESVLPESCVVPISLGYISRWLDIKKTFNVDIRILGRVDNLNVEKLFTKLVSEIDGIYITFLPVKGRYD